MYKITIKYKGLMWRIKLQELPTKENLESYFETIKEIWQERQEKTSPELDEK